MIAGNAGAPDPALLSLFGINFYYSCEWTCGRLPMQERVMKLQFEGGEGIRQPRDR